MNKQIKNEIKEAESH